MRFLNPSENFKNFYHAYWTKEYNFARFHSRWPVILDAFNRRLSPLSWPPCMRILRSWFLSLSPCFLLFFRYCICQSVNFWHSTAANKLKNHMYIYRAGPGTADRALEKISGFGRAQFLARHRVPAGFRFKTRTVWYSRSTVTVINWSERATDYRL